MSMTNFVRKVTPLVNRKNGRLANEPDEKKAAIINNFYLALEQAFPDTYEAENSVFFRTLGFGAMMNSLPTIIDVCAQNYGGFSVVNLVKMLKKVTYFDFSQWDGLAGNAGEGVAGDQFKKALIEEHGGDTQGVIKLD
jgi:hypothetical protein